MKNKSTDERTRISCIDSMRAMFMLYIIGFWHLSDYGGWNITNHIIPQMLTIGCLGGFVFISGFLLGNRKISDLNDAFLFFKKRLIRFYTPFFFACVSLYILHQINSQMYYINSMKQLVFTLIGLTVYFPPKSSTVWFISMMMVFYLLTPLINFVKSCTKRVLLCLFITVVHVGLAYFWGIDSYVCYLLLIYFIGLETAKSNLRQVEVNRVGGVGIIIVSIIIVCSIQFYGDDEIVSNLIKNTCITEILVILIWGAAKLMEKVFLLKLLLNKIGYGSMMCYLFHRQILGAIYYLHGHFSYFFAYLFALPLVIILSILLQKGYDCLVSKIINDFRLGVRERNGKN